MQVNDFYKTEGKWLKAADLKGRKHKLVISEIEIVDFKEGKKVGLMFVGKEKGLTVNKTNAQIIAEQHGQNIDSWKGQAITIYPTTTDFGGERVECIRVEQVVPEADPNDEIPF